MRACDDLFTKLDEDRDGYLRLEEVKNAVAKLGLAVPAEAKLAGPSFDASSPSSPGNEDGASKSLENLRAFLEMCGLGREAGAPAPEARTQIRSVTAGIRITRDEFVQVICKLVANQSHEVGVYLPIEEILGREEPVDQLVEEAISNARTLTASQAQKPGTVESRGKKQGGWT